MHWVYGLFDFVVLKGFSLFCVFVFGLDFIWFLVCFVGCYVGCVLLYVWVLLACVVWVFDLDGLLYAFAFLVICIVCYLLLLLCYCLLVLLALVLWDWGFGLLFVALMIDLLWFVYFSCVTVWVFDCFLVYDFICRCVI